MRYTDVRQWWYGCHKEAKPERDGSAKVRGVPERGRADEVRAQTEAEPVGHTAKPAPSLDRRNGGRRDWRLG